MTSTDQANPYTPPEAPVLDTPSEGVDSTFQLRIFSAQGRIGRLRYLGYGLILNLATTIFGALLAALISPEAVVLIYPVMIYVHIMLSIKRAHDFNSSGWMSLLALIPIVSLIFVFIPGTKGANRFGNQPAPNGKAGWFTLILVGLVVIFIVGILAAVAIPAYKGYTQRAEFDKTQQR